MCVHTKFNANHIRKLGVLFIPLCLQANNFRRESKMKKYTYLQRYRSIYHFFQEPNILLATTVFFFAAFGCFSTTPDAYSGVRVFVHSVSLHVV